MTAPTPPGPEQAHPTGQPDPSTVVGDQLGHQSAELVSTEEITAQAAHLHRLSQRIDRLDREVAELRENTAELATIAASMQSALNQLAEDLARTS